ncbi:MAG: adenosylcobalamin-dependent ribonucleoside-diphosphate reductase [Hyphomicrobiaceae bacterium]|nr:adenosylcobalamin-dependent ribonucleoside-diphosphate reductase [Hyphomicrobiaceae bacterium]
MSSRIVFQSAIARDIWERKYRLRAADGAPVDRTLGDTFRRVARAAASVEPRERPAWEKRFLDAMSDFGFLPAGRILAGAGADRQVTLFNCFVMGAVPDSLEGIFDSVKEAALTMQMGGGIGVDFSTLRPRGALVASIGADASGPVSFMHVWDAMCRTIMSAGARRGAMMATLRADHPDIEAFIDAKATAGALTNFNVSVLASDAFMAAVAADAPWHLVFDGTVYRTVRARDLWHRIMRATYETAEPGIVFIDRINTANNLAYCETIHATNPCGEQPLPPHGACLLGSLNLTRFIGAPFEDGAKLDIDALARRAGLAVRLLDNMIDVSHFALDQQRHEAKAKRRIGLGITGLADALIMCGARYDSPAGRALAGRWIEAIANAAYRASAALAAEKGAFPLYDAESMARRPNVEALDAGTKAAVAANGLRNGCLTSIAPTGTISLLAGNVSSGIEPVFDLTYRRTMTEPDGSRRDEVVEDYAFAVFKRMRGGDAQLPEEFVTAGEIAPRAHLEMQAVVQRHVDSSISKTVNCPVDMPFEAFAGIYRQAYDLGLKGVTTYRPSAVRGAVLTRMAADATQAWSAASEPAGLPGSGGVLPERATALQGVTYKLKWPGSDHALYITINDVEAAGQRRPFEIFINTRNLEHYTWTVALTRMISAIFRRGGDVGFVAEELKAIFDPQGGRWLGGRYVPSLIAAIGEIVEAHLHRTGFLSSAETVTHLPEAATVVSPEHGDADAGVAPRQCPRCGAASFVRQEGCLVCRGCGFSRCD